MLRRLQRDAQALQCLGRHALPLTDEAEQEVLSAGEGVAAPPGVFLGRQDNTKCAVKSSLLLRPVFHRLEHRIRAHVLLCWLALLLIRVAERRTNRTWRRIAIELGRVHAGTLTGSAGSPCTPPR